MQMRRETLALVTACMHAGWLMHTPNNMPVEELLPEHVVMMLNIVTNESGPQVRAIPVSQWSRCTVRIPELYCPDVHAFLTRRYRCC